MTGESSLYGMTVRRNYWKFLTKNFSIRNVEMDLRNVSVLNIRNGEQIGDSIFTEDDKTRV